MQPGDSKTRETRKKETQTNEKRGTPINYKKKTKTNTPIIFPLPPHPRDTYVELHKRHACSTQLHTLSIDTTLNGRRSAHVTQLRRKRHEIIVERIAAMRLQTDDGANDRHQGHLNG